MSVKIVTDSTAYIDARVQKEYDLTVVPLSVIFPDESYKETEVDYYYFYAKIDREGIIPTSSQPSQGDMENAFNQILEQGHEIMAIFISGELSGTCQSAYGARQAIQQTNPKARIEILDSRTTCMAMGYTVLAAAEAARKGKCLDDVLAVAKGVQERCHLFFIPDTLEYLKKGGRIGGAAAILGSLLQIKPILHLADGKVEVLEKARGKKAALDRILELLDQDEKEHGLDQVMVLHVSAVQKAAELAQTIKGRYGREVAISSIGPVIGMHAGPGTLGLVYVTQYR